MLVAADVSELNWWLRHLASRITLRRSPKLVEVTSARGLFTTAPVLTVIRKGDRTLVVGIGDVPVTEAGGMRIPAFSFSGDLLDPEEPVERFLCELLKRLPPSGGFIRPIVIVEGLPSLEDLLAGRQREFVIQASARCGVAAVVILGMGPARSLIAVRSPHTHGVKGLCTHSPT